MENPLQTWVRSFPRTERGAKRLELAEACRVTPSCVRHWCAGVRDIPDDPEKLSHIVKVTGIPLSKIKPEMARLLGAA